ncbi:MAG TPA: phytanoyl-CoA dioxygenase family protein [Pyrinomonadaceae bacterium]|nr:phytanoyl-CoA dioxygenase family protein [Pyrinomonadaceae bacterium]
MFAEPQKTEYSISDEQKAEFWQNGHILLRSVADSEEIRRFQPAVRQAVDKYNTETRSLEERDTYGKAFLQIMNLWRRDEEVKKFVFARKFAQIAADLLGVEKVRLYHDQALFKEPRGGYTPWHQDQYYWALDTEKTVTMWMPLVDIDDALGMLTFASGSHKKGALGSLEISDESEQTYKRYIAENGFPIAKADSMKAGDATFHLGWTIHSAGANLSPVKAREVMTIIYFADGARITPPQNKHQIADIEAWMGGKMPGDIADSDLNPVLN